MNFKPDNALNTTSPELGRRTKSLRRKIQAGFLLAVLLTLLTGGGLIIQLTGVEGSTPFGARDTAGETQKEGHAELMVRVRYALMGGTCLALAVLFTLYIFIVRSILHPLEHTATAARLMVDGRLDATVPIQEADEIGHIGELFNDMGVNLQELLLLVWNQTGSALKSLEGIHRQLENQQAAPGEIDIRAHLQSAQQHLGTMQTVARSFDLYDVLLTGRKAVAMEDLVDRAN
ncbi:MAG: HAMP domain-containing protein [Desulfobacterales bacterium]|nr:HAMP domain-containing protein [Desulfobacterales bacterium]